MAVDTYPQRIRYSSVSFGIVSNHTALITTVSVVITTVSVMSALIITVSVMSALITAVSVHW